MQNVYKFLKFLSIHDVLTPRADVSDPTNSSDKGPQPGPAVLREIRTTKPVRNPPLRPLVEQAPYLRYASIHDILTPRDKNKTSDPTMKKDKKHG